MQKPYSIICSVVFLVFNSGDVYSSVLKQNGRDLELSIIHFNDFHAMFEETSTSSTPQCNPALQKCIGGFPRLVTVVNKLMAEDPSSVLLNAGDDFQGSLWYNFLKWNVTQYFINMLPLDAQTIGNHEFDDRVEGLVPYLKALKAPVLVANMDVTEEPTLNGLFKDSHIIERNGVKIGLIGVLIKTTNMLASTGKVRFTDEVQAVRRVANVLTSQGVKIIIVISHSGIETDRLIAANVNNVDIIVGGHSHILQYPRRQASPNGEIVTDDYPATLKQKSGGNVLIVHASAFTKYVGDLKVKFNSNGEIVSWSGSPIYLDSSIPQDEKILKEMEPFKAIVKVASGRVVGHTTVKLDRANCILTDTNIGNFMTDAFVDYSVDLAPEGIWSLASIGLMNCGAIRANIDRGNITYDKLILSQPFSNQIQTFNLQGKYLLEALEYAVSASYRLQVSGLEVVYNMRNALGNRVESVKVRCSQCNTPTYSDLNPNAYYSVVAPDFLANGGDGYESISKNKINPANQGVDVDIIERYLEKHSPISPQVEGRLKYVRR